MTDQTYYMSRRALCAALTLALSCSIAHAADLREAVNPVQGQYIVVLKDDIAALAHERSASRRPDVATIASEIGRSHRATVVRSYRSALRGFVVKADDAALAGLLADERVAYVEEDGYVTTSATQSNATWGLDRVDQRDRPLSGTYTYDTTASTVNAYIIDTGVLASHSDFGGRVGSGYTAISDGRGTTDCNGHGTHVAGTVGGATWGVAKGVRLYPVRVLGCNGSGTNSGVIAGVDWVRLNHVKPAVANMSLGGGPSSALDTAVNNAINAGVTMVVAAGNDNGDACYGSPNGVPNAVTVGSTTSSDARSSFSNYGRCLDIFAPGSSITSAWYTSNTATNTISGTSMAAPHVAGAAALYLAGNPTATPQQVRDYLVTNATSGRLTSIGTGSPNLLLYTLGTSTPPPPPPPATTYTNSDDYAIRDHSTVESPISISGRSGNASSSTAVAVNIVHTYIGDLKVDLVAPDGSIYVLHNRSGGSADNINTTYTVNLSSELINGTWKLRVNDNYTYDTGYINSWSITP